MRAGGLIRLGSVSVVALAMTACGSAHGSVDQTATTAVPSASPSVSATHSSEMHDLVRLTGQVSGREVIDSSGRDNDGMALGTSGGVVGGGTVKAPFLVFSPKVCLESADCPLGVVVLDPAAKQLVPANAGAGPFSFGGTVRLTVAPPEHAGMNVMQRGVFGAGKSQWKLQADYGKPSCRWSDGKSTVQLPNKTTSKPPTLQVGDWYTLHCDRLADGSFRMTVSDGSDGALFHAEASGDGVGSIAPTGPVLLGANSESGESQELSDQLHADLKDVFFATTS